jgi:hypothetical protein
MDCINDNQENLMFTVHENGKQYDADEQYKPDPNGGMDYVAATLHAWNQCPTIVKKQMDDQYQELVWMTCQVQICRVPCQELLPMPIAPYLCKEMQTELR